jgi:hypothetical protein
MPIWLRLSGHQLKISYEDDFLMPGLLSMSLVSCLHVYITGKLCCAAKTICFVYIINI